MIQVTIKYDKLSPDGTIKKVKEQYISMAKSCSEAEIQVISFLSPFIEGDYEIITTSKATYKETLLGNGNSFYKVRLALITLDEKTGQEKTTKVSFLVSADSLLDAIKHTEEIFNGNTMNYKLLSIQETAIIDCL